jgi:putative flippase GtrA
VDRIEPAALGSWRRFGSFGRFVTSGAFNTLATYLLYLALLTQLPYRVSFTIAYACGIGLAYALNRYLVFRRPGGRAGPFLVPLIYVGQYLLNLALVSAWVQWFSAPAALAPLFAVAVTLPLTYLLNRRVFSTSSPNHATESSSGLRWKKLQPWAVRIAMPVLIGLPLMSLAINAVAWLRFGIDLPFFDDWRGYDSGDIDSFDLPYLFRPVNDTLTPIGFALDALAQRLIDGNSVLYQLFSMLAVLGTLLLLQWKLLRSTLGDPWRTALCFVFTLLMLQPGSYWGRENLAYQQALPIVLILAALWVTTALPWRDRWNVPIVFLLGLLAGFSYISGAFGALAAGVAVIAIALVPRNLAGRARTLRAGASLAVAGAAVSWAQFYYAIAPQKGGTHQSGKPLALPIEPEFWLYYLGKLARSLLLPQNQPVLSLILVLLVVALLIAAVVTVIRSARSAEAVWDQRLRLALVLGAIGAMVFTYLLMVSAGRANYRPVEVQGPAEVFAYGFQRFHYFWATLLWPWLAAAVLVAVDRWRVSETGRWVPAAATAALVACVFAMVQLGALGHSREHRREGTARHVTVECLMVQLQKGEGIRCDEWRMLDLTPAFIYARQIGASFVRYFPILPIDVGIDSPSPWFRLSRDADRVLARNVEVRSGRYYPANEDPQLVIDVEDAVGMASCVMLDVRGTIRTDGLNTMKLFFRPLGQEEFSETSAVPQRVGAQPTESTFSFRLENAIGFESALRLDPVESRQNFELGELEVRCRLRGRDNTVTPFYAMADTSLPPSLHNLKPKGDGEGRFSAGANPGIVFRTGRRHTMASCAVLELQAIYQVEKKDVARLSFRPLGVNGFSDTNSVSKEVVPQSRQERVVLVATSSSGFEDHLRFEPAQHPQTLRFADIQVRCLQRGVQNSHLR